VKIFEYNFSIVIPCLKINRKYHTTTRTAGCGNSDYQTTSRELLWGLRSTATVTVHGGELHSHVTCCTYCLILTRLRSSKHINVWMKSARSTLNFFMWSGNSSTIRHRGSCWRIRRAYDIWSFDHKRGLLSTVCLQFHWQRDLSSS
jgi:late competence protein required for DNA uptake (superfamily II DNA/RNA helicase)